MSKPEDPVPVDGPTQHAPLDGIALERVRVAARTRLFGEPSVQARVGRYIVGEKLGEGGMGVVYAAHDPELERPVALKLLRGGGEEREEVRLRLRREAQAMAKVSHPNVAHVYEVGRHDDQVFVAMELVGGPTLRAWQTQETRSWREVLAMHVQAGQGLAAAHAEGIVHRDYKPDNVIVGGDGRPRVLDFGLATPSRAVEQEPDLDSRQTATWAEASLTLSGAVLGTPAYMAAEQLKGEGSDARSDQFAFCVALFEGLYGLRPFDGATLRELSANVADGTMTTVDDDRTVPTSIREAVVRGLNPDPQLRHRSMEDLLRTLARELDAPPPRVSRHRRGWWLVGGAVTLVVAATVGWRGGQRNALPPVSMPAQQSEPGSAKDAILAQSRLPAVLPEPHPDDPLGVTIHRLSNGLTVYIAPRHDQPRISSQVVVRVGRMDEPSEFPGVGYMLQRAMAMGTARIGTTDFAAERKHLDKRDALYEALAKTEDVERRAALLEKIDAENQATSGVVLPQESDRLLKDLGVDADRGRVGPRDTVQAAELPSSSFRAWARFKGDQLQDPAFRLFLPQLRAMEQELRELGNSFANGTAAVLETFAEAAGLTPYSHRVIDLSQAPLVAVKDFYRRWYVPNNTALILVGDIDAATALPVVEAYFGAWEPAPLRERGQVTRRSATQNTRRRAPIGERDVVLGWTSIGTPEPAPWSLFLELLGGRGGVLTQLVATKRLSNVRLWTPDDAGVFALEGSSAVEGKDRPFDAVEGALLEALRDVADGRVDAGALEAAKTRRQHNRLRARHGNNGVSAQLAHVFSTYREWAEVVERESRDADPSMAQIQAVARGLLEQPWISVHSDGTQADWPVSAAPASTPVEVRLDRSSAFADELRTMPRAPQQPQFLVQGRDYTVRERGGNLQISSRIDASLFQLTLRYPHDPERFLQFCWPARWVLKGLREESLASSEREGDRAIPQLNLETEVVCFGTQTWVLVRGLDRHFEAGARFAEEFIRRSIRNARGSFGGAARIPHDFEDTVNDGFAFPQPGEGAWFGDQRENFGLPSPGDESRQIAANSFVAGTNVAVKVRADAFPSFVPDVLYSGPREDIALATPSVKPRAVEQQPDKMHWPTRAALVGKLVLAKTRGGSLTRTSLLFLGRPHSEEDEVYGDIFDEYMSGTNGLVTQGLRGVDGLASSSAMVGVTNIASDGNRFGVATIKKSEDGLPSAVSFVFAPAWGNDRHQGVLSVFYTTPANAGLAIARALELLRRPIDVGLFERALARVEARYRGQRVAAHDVPLAVLDWHDDGYRNDPRAARWSALPKVTLERFEAFIAARTKESPYVLVAGPVSELDRTMLPEFVGRD